MSSFQKLHYPSSTFKQSVMSPVKDEGSFHHRGKEVTVDDPPAKTMGEETPFSELDHSEEEDRDSDTKVYWPFWFLRFPILIYVKGHHFPCPFSLSLGRAPFWVGRSKWIRSCPMWVSWRRYSKPVYWRHRFVSVLVQLSRLVQSLPFGLLMVQRHPYILPFLLQDHRNLGGCGKPTVVAYRRWYGPKQYRAFRWWGGCGSLVKERDEWERKVDPLGWGFP